MVESSLRRGTGGSFIGCSGRSGRLPSDALREHVLGEAGGLVLSAFWGDYDSSTEGLEIRSGEVCTMLCRHRGKSLRGEENCEACRVIADVP